MTDVCTRANAAGAMPHESGNRAAPGAADWLCLAAAPTFALMALLTGVLDGAQMCAASPLTGMAAMYLLMSAFHLTPWLKLIARGGGAPN